MPAHKSLRWTTLAALLLFSISCKEDDHEPEQTCLFAGESTAMTSPSSSVIYGNEVVINEQNQLISAKRSDSNEAFSSTKKRLWKRSNSYNYTPQYNSEGYLTQMVLVKKDLYEGTVGNSYQYNGQPYLNFTTETTQTSDYQYESGHIASIATKTVTRIQGDNATPIVNEGSQTKVYTYDSQGNPVSALTTSGSNTVTTTFKNGVIANEISRNAGGATTSQNEYNEKGLQTAIIGNGFRYDKTYDAKGNLTSLQFTLDGKVNYLQEFSYDDHKNPETDVPVEFKGIPENIVTVQNTEHVNNLINEKFTSYAGGSNYDSPYVYKYNASGLPESWSPKDPGDGYSMITIFNYQCR